MTTWTPDQHDTDVPVGINIAWGTAVLVVAAFVAAAVSSRHADLRFIVVAFAIGLFAEVTGDVWAAAAVVALAWFVVNGFLVDRFGQLSWHGTPDLLRLLLLATAAGLGLAIERARSAKVASG